jgi:phosphatidylglycerol:prolipoprotein diacylglycerol transferase
MYPTLFHLPLLHIPIYGYGLMMVFAFLGTQWLSSRLAASRGIDPEIFVNVTLIALISGVIGSRLSHVLENASTYFDPSKGFATDLWNIVNIRSGGLTFYGGFILAAPVVLFYLLYRKVTARMAMDICAPCLMLGLGIGRLGCFLNGCCYGAPTHVAWGVSFPYNSNAYDDAVHNGLVKVPKELRYPPDGPEYRPVTNEELARGYVETHDPEMPRYVLPDNARAVAAATHAPAVHPAQLYSTITALLLCGLLLAYFYMPHAGGRVFALMMMLEGPSRFLLEMLRVEPPVYPPLFGRLSLSMVIGVLVFIVGVMLWFGLGTAKDQSPGYAGLQPA